MGPPTATLLCGEVRTGLLPTRDAVDEHTAELLLRLRADERVRVSRRPNRCVVSPDVLTGVDCRLPTADGARARAVGTVTSRAVLTEGRVLQATAHFRVASSGPDRRQPWGYYLVRPGLLVPVGKVAGSSVAEGFLNAGLNPGPNPGPNSTSNSGRQGELDVGAIAENLLARISRRPRLLDYDPPLTTTTTRLRWTAIQAIQATPTPGSAPPLRFTLGDEGRRSVELRLPEGVEPTAVAALCEDLALHDWLLTTLGDRLDGLRPGSAESRVVLKVLRPLVDHLLHLWLPKARVRRELAELWDELEVTPGFTRQWETLAQRIRDQLVLRSIREAVALNDPLAGAH